MLTRLFSILAATSIGLALFGAKEAHAQDCVPPRILLIMDMSSSMTDLIDGTSTVKWEAAQSAISDVLTTHGDAAHYGLMTFPGSSSGCATGDVRVDVGMDQATLIDNWVATHTPATGGSYTPAGQSLMAASQYNLITDSQYDNYVVFVTDGHQWCEVGTPPNDTCASPSDCAFMGVSPCPTCHSTPTDGCYCVQGWPVIGTQALADAGVTTYVVGFGTSVNVGVLNEAADVGGAPLPGCDPNSTDPSCYFQATMPAELTAALGQIVHEVVTETCTGPCGIEGERSCTTDGWTDCDAPDTVSCTSSCDTPGTQQCVSDQLTECSSEVDCVSTGGSGAGAYGGTGGTGAWGGAGATGGGNLGEDPEEEGGCGCRSVGGTDRSSP
ncbi:MAG: VWA domain-containing protein, partial [Deltaproteobacteria bacterium]|nr:VWA domain-containing protein [Deltaproteobacteria bacterium]MBW2537117.1 VWA domain-containing protein [Deltaproteobacteria bacterium]